MLTHLVEAHPVYREHNSTCSRWAESRNAKFTASSDGAVWLRRCQQDVLLLAVPLCSVTELQETEVCVSLGEKINGPFLQKRCFESPLPNVCRRQLRPLPVWACVSIFDNVMDFGWRDRFFCQYTRKDRVTRTFRPEKMWPTKSDGVKRSAVFPFDKRFPPWSTAPPRSFVYCGRSHENLTGLQMTCKLLMQLFPFPVPLSGISLESTSTNPLSFHHLSTKNTPARCVYA